MTDLKRLMLVPLVYCVSIQQTDAKVVYSPDKTETFKKKINEKTNKNKTATINDVAHEAFTSLLPIWSRNDNIFYDQTKQMPGIAAFVPTGSSNAINNAKVYLGWKYAYDSTDPETTPPNNKPDEQYGDAPLFEYSDYSHTERQLAIYALNNVNNKKTEITEDSPICLRDEEKTQKQQQTKAAKTLTNRMSNTKGMLYIYTPVPMCTFSTNLKENGGILCVDYYAYLLQCCPGINIHVYCDSRNIYTLSPHVLYNVYTDEIFDEMYELLRQIPTYQYKINAPIIEYIRNEVLVNEKNTWMFVLKNNMHDDDIWRINDYANHPNKIKEDIMFAIRQYIKKSSRSKQYSNYRDKLLTALIRLSLKKSHSDLNKNEALNRLTMHLITTQNR